MRGRSIVWWRGRGKSPPGQLERRRGRLRSMRGGVAGVEVGLVGEGIGLVFDDLGADEHTLGISWRDDGGARSVAVRDVGERKPDVVGIAGRIVLHRRGDRPAAVGRGMPTGLKKGLALG